MDNGGSGAGGDGVVVMSGAYFTNAGLVQGGNAGVAYGTNNIPLPSTNTATGMGGSGIRVGSDVYVLNTGTVKPGTGYDGASAIAIDGDNSTLELRAGSDIQGNVTVTNGKTRNTFVLGGTADSIFSAAQIGSKYRGFTDYKKIGASKWRLADIAMAATPWRIEEGTISVSQDGGLGSPSGKLTLAGGMLNTTSSFVLNHDVFLESGNSSINVDGSTTLTAANKISGDGAFTKSGDGRLIILNELVAGGGTNIHAGVLQIGDGSTKGRIISNVFNEGILLGNGVVNDLNNKGAVLTGADMGFGTLTVNGNYTSDGGTLILREELGDDTSLGDRLVVAGNTSGTTEVMIINQGGAGEQTINGIKVIEVGGQSDGVFNLNGDYVNYRGAQAVVAGAYAYTLEKGGRA